MEMRQLQSLVAVIRYQSFTKAAEMLFISQPTISMHIRTLEEELNTRLIIRTTKNIEITPHGWELYECARKMFSLRDGLIERWREEKDQMIRLGASTIPSDYILPEILPKFRSSCAEAQFYIHQSDSDKIIDGILSGEFAVGMVGMKRKEKSILYVPFYQDRMVMITPVEERFEKLRGGEKTILDTILQEPVLLREQGSGSKKCIETYFEKMKIREKALHVVARLNDQESIKKLVAGGFGISFISEKAVEDYEREKKLLVFRLPDYVMERKLYLVYRRDYILKASVVQFINFVQEYYQVGKEKEINVRI